ncbi:MAG TPA: glycosyltransferase family 2 protein, partial [Flavisolibacter sp.]|nr:glycosyltransferase family 2 protein [Flavisolibacter sp.]
PNWEWVIVDDGSTDNSLEVLQKFAAADRRVKVFSRHRGPKGACTCRNIAVENATGDYLIFLDTDDLLAPYCLQQRMEAARKDPEYDFIIFPMLLFRQKPDDMGLLWNTENGEDDLHRLLVGDPICQGTGTLWKKEAFVKAGMWKEDLMLWQDVELHIRTILKGCTYKKRLDLLPDVFLRVSEVSLSRTNYHSLPKLQSRIRVFKETTLTIARQRRFDQYKKGLHHMATNLVTSAIRSSYFDDAREIIAFCVEQEVFSAGEKKFFTYYLNIRKLKLNKVPFLMHMIDKRIKSLHNGQKHYLGTVPYTRPIPAINI